MNEPPGDDDLRALVAQMRAEISALTRRVGELEEQLGAAPAAVEEAPSEETLLVIAAAVAAFLGVRAHIRQVRLVQSSAWGQVGRIGVHASHRRH